MVDLEIPQAAQNLVMVAAIVVLADGRFKDVDTIQKIAVAMPIWEFRPTWPEGVDGSRPPSWMAGLGGYYEMPSSSTTSTLDEHLQAMRKVEIAPTLSARTRWKPKVEPVVLSPAVLASVQPLVLSSAVLASVQQVAEGLKTGVYDKLLDQIRASSVVPLPSEPSEGTIIKVRNHLGYKVVEKVAYEPARKDVHQERITDGRRYLGDVINDTYTIQQLISEMGTGKTQAILEYLAKHPDARVLIISTRKSFTYAMATTYNARTYLDEDIDMDQEKRIIVQVESLHRIGGKLFDIVIIDEHLAVFGQLQSHLHGSNLSSNQRLFQLVCTHARKIVLCDASYSQDLLETYIMSWRQEIPLVTINPYRSTGYKCTILRDYAWLEKLEDLLKEGKTIQIVCTSKMWAKDMVIPILEQAGLRSGPGGYRFYEKNDAPTREELANINHETKGWQQYKVVMYTPIIGVGVDFNVEHFDYRFVYGTYKSVPAHECIQGGGRCRYVRMKMEYACLEDCKGRKATNYQTLYNRLNSRLQLMGQVVKGTKKDIPTTIMERVHYKVVEDKIERFLQTDEWVVGYIKYQMIINASYNNYSQCYLTHMRDKGWAIDDQTGILNEEKKLEIVQQIVEAKEASKEAALEIKSLTLTDLATLVNIADVKYVQSYGRGDMHKDYIEYGRKQEARMDILERKILTTYPTVAEAETLHLYKLHAHLRPRVAISREEASWLLEDHKRLYRLLRLVTMSTCTQEELKELDLERMQQRQDGFSYTVMSTVMEHLRFLMGVPVGGLILGTTVHSSDIEAKLDHYWELCNFIRTAQGNSGRVIQKKVRSVAQQVNTFLTATFHLSFKGKKIGGRGEQQVAYTVLQDPIVTSLLTKIVPATRLA